MQVLDERRSSVPVKSLLIVDDSAAWRRRVREILEEKAELRIIAEACDGFQATQRAAELKLDLVLLDIGMPVLNGLDAAAQIRRISPQSKIVFLTQESDTDVRRAAVEAGAHGYVLKANAASELLPTITTVLGNGHRANYADALRSESLLLG
jgi:DNA-binding NarL/FixJ family response regulator